MWWYYKCVNLIKVLIQGSKVILFSIENALQKTSRAGGAPPRTDALIGPAAFGDVQENGLFKTTRERRASLSSLLQLSGAPELLRAQTRARLTWKPARWTLTTKPTIGGGLRPCQSRNGATKSTIAEESFPRWRHAAISSLHTRTTEGARAEHVTPETKNSRGKTSQLRACFKPIQASTNWIPNPDWTG